MSDPVALHLTASGIDTYCRELSRRAPSLEKRVTSLDALITFISAQTNAGEQAKPEYAAIKQTLLGHFEQARQELLDERSQRLLQAVKRHNLPAIAAIYTSLSRDAFWTLLGRVEQQLDTTAIDTLRNWAQEWMTQSKQRAQMASPYPDAIDFTAAGIDPTEYLVMSDVCRYFGVNL